MAAPIGNTNAASAREWREAIKRVMARKAEGDFRKTLESVAEQVVDAALAGEKDAWKEIGDRFDGKPPQAIIGGDEGDPEIKHNVRVEFVKP